ncbi:MAG: NUDIX domain-containing protein [Neisseria sp.]|nr:NUDIX domain-containing protein [Neisseria sp.]
MPPLPRLSPLPEKIQTLLFERLSACFLCRKPDWRPLRLNGLSLGLLNEAWYGRLLDARLPGCTEGENGLQLGAAGWRETGETLQHLARGWYEAGLFHGWRGERFDVFDGRGRVLFELERAAFRPFGLYSRAVHINGMTRTAQGWHFWIGRRSPHKAVDPGKLDNLVGGGIAAGETAVQAMRREAWEEAGLGQGLPHFTRFAGKLHSLRLSPRGLHREYLYVFDSVLPPETLPQNRDGEVDGFLTMTAEEAADAMWRGGMTDDAMLVTLDLFRRVGLVDAARLFAAYPAGLFQSA